MMLSLSIMWFVMENNLHIIDYKNNIHMKLSGSSLPIFRLITMEKTKEEIIVHLNHEYPQANIEILRNDVEEFFSSLIEHEILIQEY